jgi:hypothetical protein
VRRGFKTGAAWLAQAALLLGFACTELPQPRASRPPRAALGSGGLIGPAFTSPARLRYHPRQRARPLAERALEGGKRLIVGEGGERWIYDEPKRALSAGAALAPEGLIGMLENEGKYWFVGASGTMYESSGWLSPFERSIAPAEPLIGVTTAGTTVLGVSSQRTLLQSRDFGATWVGVGPAGTAFVDVALSKSGEGYALAVPEALYRTADYGATWQRVSIPAIGMVALQSTPDGVEASTVYAPRVPGADGRWHSPAAPTKPRAELPPPPRGPDAAALAEGRATIDGPRYLELAAKSAGAWELWSGSLTEALAARPFDEARGCTNARLASFGRYVAFACFRTRNDSATQPIELFGSDSGGKTFQRVAGRYEGTSSTFRLAVGANGDFVVSGVCSSPLGATCNQTGVQHGNLASAPEPAPAKRRAKAGSQSGSLSATPSLSDAPQALAFSSDGKTAYAVGRRTKTSRFALFVSRDGGKTFEPEDLDLVPFAPEEDDVSVDRTASSRVEALSPAEDGAVAIVFASYGRRVLVVTDERGKLLSSSEAPEARALLGASGLRAISITPATRQLWESLDGGVTFQPVLRLPVSVCPNDSTCDVPIRCGPEACVVGQTLSRIGWGGQAEDQASLLPPPLRPSPPPAQRKLRTPIGCALDAAPWRALPGVSEPPDVYDADIGAVDWYAVAEDPDRAAVTLFVSEKGKVAPLVLFEPSERPEDRAFNLTNQLEGVAAVRYRIPESTPPSLNLTDVEVAWTNFFEGRVGKVRLKDGGPYSTGDYIRGPARAQQAVPALVSVASKGLYLRLHTLDKADQPTLFLDGKRVVTLPAPQWPAGMTLPMRNEMAHLGDAHVSVGLVGRGAAVARAGLQTPGAEFSAFTTGLPFPGAFGLNQTMNVAYVGDRAGAHIEQSDESGSFATAVIFPFQAEGDAVGAPVPVPTLFGLGDRPSACSVERRAKTPRVISAPTQGTLHPVVVSDSVEGPRTLLTTGAVLHGTPDAPCASTFGAVLVPADGAPPSRESALISLDTPERSVLFRVMGDGAATRVEYRAMNCRFDPNLDVPAEAYRALSGVR